MVNLYEKLRKAGCRIRVHHQRFYRGYDGFVKHVTLEPVSRQTAAELGFESYDMEPRGGATRVQVTTPEGQHFIGGAECSDHDGYNKAIGRETALRRAIRDGHLGHLIAQE